MISEWAAGLVMDRLLRNWMGAGVSTAAVVWSALAGVVTVGCVGAGVAYESEPIGHDLLPSGSEFVLKHLQGPQRSETFLWVRRNGVDRPVASIEDLRWCVRRLETVRDAVEYSELLRRHGRLKGVPEGTLLRPFPGGAKRGAGWYSEEDRQRWGLGGSAEAGGGFVVRQAVFMRTDALCGTEYRIDVIEERIAQDGSCAFRVVDTVARGEDARALEPLKRH